MRTLAYKTADDEEPNCMSCDNQCQDESFCGRFCGPEHSWSRYTRQEVDDETD